MTLADIIASALHDDECVGPGSGYCRGINVHLNQADVAAWKREAEVALAALLGQGDEVCGTCDGRGKVWSQHTNTVPGSSIGSGPTMPVPCPNPRCNQGRVPKMVACTAGCENGKVRVNSRPVHMGNTHAPCSRCNGQGSIPQPKLLLVEVEGLRAIIEAEAGEGGAYHPEDVAEHVLAKLRETP